MTPRGEERNRLQRWWGWLLLTTLALLLLVATRYFEVVDLDVRPWSLLFRWAMLIGHFTTIAAIALLPVLLVSLAWPQPKLVIPLGVVFGATLVIALMIDTQVYQLYRFHINAGVLNLIFGGAARETFVFSGQMYAQATLIASSAIGLVAAASLWFWRQVRLSAPRRNVSRSIAATLAVALVIFHGAHIWADAVGYEPFLEQTEVLPLRYAATAKRMLRSTGIDLPKTRLAQTDDARGHQLSYPLQPVTCQAPENPPNIVVILIDSWRFDALTPAVTPNIDAFAQHSVRFMDHYSGGNATRIGMFSLFYSIPGTYWHRMLSERRGPVLIDELSELNYDVQVFRSAPLHSPEFDRTVFAKVNAPRARSDGDSPAAWDRDLTNDFLGYLDSRPESSPFFALLFYDAPHSFDYPKTYPPVFQPAADHVNYFGLQQDTDPLPLLNRYRNSLHYVDSLVGEALGALKARGLLENSVIIVSGDHGQEFNDAGQNYWGHASNFTRFQTGVPLLIYAPQLEPKVYHHRTTHFDVMPTVMRNYLGCNDPFSTYSVGRSLFEAGGRETIVLSEYADFAIMHADQTAVVRKHGMEMRDKNYLELDAHFAPEVVEAALEQKTRFTKRALLQN